MRRVLALVACAGAACGRADAPIAAAPARDSAGVRIVESAAPAWGTRPAWRIAARPDVEVGGVAGDSARDFAGVRSAVRFADGRFVVADGATEQLRLFDATGAHLRTLGGRGEGERQFVELGAVFLRGDTIVGWDDRRQRIVGFLPDGRFLGNVRAMLPDTTRLGRPVGIFPGGAMLVTVPTPVDLAVVDSPVLRVDADLVRLEDGGRNVARVRSDEIVVRRGKGTVSAMMRPFGLSGRVAVVGDEFVVGEGEGHSFRRHAEDGRLVAIFRRPGARLPLVPADTAREHGLRVGAARTVRERESIDGIWRSMPFPDSLPAHGEIVADPSGGVWVRDIRHAGDSTSSYQAYAKDGTWLGAVTLPPRSTLLWVGTDAVLLRRLDGNDVEFVAVHRLRR
ncbi:MAG TPA: hypothetical protein VFY20_12840 [Gemmatimonadales bacterium]|nr:hypothetical protein [Gemmatimonadales bacterium]